MYADTRTHVRDKNGQVSTSAQSNVKIGRFFFYYKSALQPTVFDAHSFKNGKVHFGGNRTVPFQWDVVEFMLSNFWKALFKFRSRYLHEETRYLLLSIWNFVLTKFIKGNSCLTVKWYGYSIINQSSFKYHVNDRMHDVLT